MLQRNVLPAADRLALFNRVGQLTVTTTFGDVLVDVNKAKCPFWECDFQDDIHCDCINGDSYQCGFIDTSIATFTK